MAETNYDIIGRKLEVLDPAKFNNLNNPPILTELSCLPDILPDISAISFQSNFTREQIIIASILRLYEPDVLNGWKKSIDRNGITNQLASFLNKSSSNISHIISKVRNYYLIYKKFHDEVDYIAGEIGEKYLHFNSENI